MHNFYFPPLLTLSSIQCQAYSSFAQLLKLSGFISIFSETSLKKLSQMDALHNCGDRWGNL